MTTPLDTMTFPALLRGARATYGAAIRQALTTAGFEDVPRNGIFVIGAIVRSEPLAGIITGLGVSKQAAGQLVDTMVLRGYLAREVDDTDRRRLTVTLTDRGRAAGNAARVAIKRIDTALINRMGDERVAHARAVLAALMDLGSGDG